MAPRPALARGCGRAALTNRFFPIRTAPFSTWETPAYHEAATVVSRPGPLTVLPELFTSSSKQPFPSEGPVVSCHLHVPCLHEFPGSHHLSVPMGLGLSLVEDTPISHTLWSSSFAGIGRPAPRLPGFWPHTRAKGHNPCLAILLVCFCTF